MKGCIDPTAKEEVAPLAATDASMQPSTTAATSKTTAEAEVQDSVGLMNEVAVLKAALADAKKELEGQTALILAGQQGIAPPPPQGDPSSRPVIRAAQARIITHACMPLSDCTQCGNARNLHLHVSVPHGLQISIVSAIMIE